MLQNTYDDKSTLVQVMTQCHQATSHYLGQCCCHMASLGHNELKSLNGVSLQAQLVCMFRLTGCVDLQGRLARSLADSASTAVSCPLSGQGREQWESVLGHRKKNVCGNVLCSWGYWRCKDTSHFKTVAQWWIDVRDSLHEQFMTSVLNTMVRLSESVMDWC